MSDNPVYVWLKGRWVKKKEAVIGVEDRGFLFADSLYEVIRYYNGCGFEKQAHLNRLEKGLQILGIPFVESDKESLSKVCDEIVQRNNSPEAIVYIHITRGESQSRSHCFKEGELSPTCLVMSYPVEPFKMEQPQRLTAVLREDVRWKLCHIKATTLLPNVLDAQEARRQGADEAILYREETEERRVITEGTHRSIITVSGGYLYTYPLDGRILESITRDVVLNLAREKGYHVVEGHYTMNRLLGAEEVIAVGSSSEVASVVSIEGCFVGGTGDVGPVATDLFKAYYDLIKKQCYS